MRDMYRYCGVFVRVILVLGLLGVFALGCSSDDDDDNGTTPTNHAPVVASVTLSSQTLPYTGGTVTVTVSASDADGDNLTYSYSATLGTITGSGASANWVLGANSGTNPLTASVTVTVSDGSLNATGQAGLTIEGQGTQQTTLSGTLSLQAGVNGNLDNTQVAIYATIADWNNYTPAKFVAAVGVGAGSTANYTMTGVPQGAWYMDAWKDIDANFFWSSGDFVGWWGSGGLGAPVLSPFTITQGESKVINITGIIPIP